MASPSSSRKRKRSKKLSAEKYLRAATSYVSKGTPLDRYLSQPGALRFVRGSDDEKHYNEVRRLLRTYIKGDQSRPLSIVVFGPPGSGKSFYVERLAESLKGKETSTKTGPAHKRAKSSKTKDKLGDLVKINMAQLHAPQELSELFEEHSNEKAALKQKVDTKIFFFDEFDSSLEGVSLGWLRWFLAPMQDGKFFNGYGLKDIGKSIFIFAGGTAATLNEFEEHSRIDQAAYHEKKVPDFISRLRAFINITGINGPGNDRPVRRAVILRGYLEKKFSTNKKKASAIKKKGSTKKSKLPIKEESARGLLSNAHYIHGTRSMEALLEMSRWRKGQQFENKKHLPPQHLMELHVSRGPLNGVRVGISAGLKEKITQGFLIRLSGRLFENGADLAYGGNLDKAGTLRAMVKAAKNTSEDLLEREEEQRIRNYLGYPAYRDPDLIPLNEEVKDQVKVVPLSTLSPSECNDLDVPPEIRKPKPEQNYFPARPRKKRRETEYYPKHHLAWSLSLFRMRVHMIQDLSALIVFGGKDDGQSWGRFSGIAEEIMLALALKKPVYVLGKAGGAGLAVGKLLGLDETLVNPDTCLADIGSIEHSPLYKHYKHAFVLPEQPNLPRTVAEVRNYLFEHGVTSSTWPWNGLTPEQNRELFNTELSQEDDSDHNKKSCISLIIEGLTRLDWKKQSRNSQETKTMGRAHSAG